MKQSLLNYLILFFVLTCASYAFAEIYKWTDTDGNIIYGDTAVPSNAKKIKIKKPPLPDENYKKRIEKRSKLLDVIQEEREAKFAKQEREVEQRVKRKAVCKRLIAKLEKMKNASYLYEKTDDQFNPIILSDGRRKKEEQKYQNYINENCNET